MAAIFQLYLANNTYVQSELCLMVPTTCTDLLPKQVLDDAVFINTRNILPKIPSELSYDVT